MRGPPVHRLLESMQRIACLDDERNSARALDAARAAHVMETLLHAIARDRARAAILDLTGVEEVDVATAGHLLRIARSISLLGSRCLVSGISPRIAQTMTSIGIGAEGFATFGTLEDALRHAIHGAGAGARGKPNRD